MKKIKSVFFGEIILTKILSMACLFLSILAPAQCFAAKMGSKNGSSVSYTSSDEGTRGSSRGPTEMLFDLSINYVRDTMQDSSSDTAARFSLGGMFNHWMGLDLQGLFEVKSKSFLVGTDLRLAPTDWFFIKGGVGGYADKKTNAFRLTPLAGTGILARIDRDYYLFAEGSYFQVSSRNNIALGVGAGISF